MSGGTKKTMEGQTEYPQVLNTFPWSPSVMDSGFELTVHNSNIYSDSLLFRRHLKRQNRGRIRRMPLFNRRRSSENEYNVSRYLQDPEEREELGDNKELKEEEEFESPPEDELQKMSMPELWRRATELGISKKGKRDELIERIKMAQKGQGKEPEKTDVLELLEQLRTKLKEFEKIREGIKTKVESISKLAPKLNERKELLEKEIHDKQKKVAEIGELIPKLEEKKVSLREDIRQKQEEMELLEKDIHEREERLSEIAGLIPRLEENRKKIHESMQRKQREISKVDEQITQLLNVQKYGLDLVSTLMYANKKGKE